MTLVILLSLLVILCSLNHAASEVYNITNSTDPQYTVQLEPCLTLSQFVANLSRYLNSSNTTLVFLPGTHYLSTGNLILSDMDYFAMKSENSKAQIKCTNDSHIHFSQSSRIHITNLEFIGCGGNQVRQVEQFAIKDAKFEGQGNSGMALELIGTTAQILNSIFVSNRNGSYRQCTELSNLGYCKDNSGFIGGAIIAISSTIDISQSTFEANRADYGGAIFAFNSTININGNTSFINNTAIGGGVIASFNSNIIINESIFHNNTASVGGGVLVFISGSITIEASEFVSNNGFLYGGVLDSLRSNITIKASEFYSTAAHYGGVFWVYKCAIKIESSEFTENRSPMGAVIYAIEGSMIEYCNYLLVENNTADSYGVIYLSDSEFQGNDSGNFTFSNNLGSLVAFNSNVTFSGYATFVNNQPQNGTSRDFQEGGAFTLFQSNLYFDGECILEQNHAENGGAIHSTESKLYVNGDATIAHNRATANGGGVYLSFSELNCQQKSTFQLLNNTVENKGGGLHAISSSIRATSRWNQYFGPKIHFTNNTAKKGGGLSLEANAKLYILKYEDYVYTESAIFTGNSADYGGAVYVDDDTNSGTCASDPKTECFFQVLAVYTSNNDKSRVRTSLSFSGNSASISGNILYGGLLDRCAVSPFAEYDKQASYDKVGIDYLKKVSNIAIDNNINIIKNVSSEPVRVCHCTNNTTYNCTASQSPNIIMTRKGDAFKVLLVAVDQLDQPDNATIQTSLKFADSELLEGQLNEIPAECTELTFNVVSQDQSETLSLYASDGPCKNAELSTAKIEINFLPCSCPIGLQVSDSETNCLCDCHSNISQYVEPCDDPSGSLVKMPQSRVWIDYINDTGYLVYPNCPFDYCLSNSSDYKLNFNEPNGSGADAQCAFSRSSRLCGSCQSGHSLSLGSSHCLQCSDYWPAVFIAITITAILAGIALVALLLVLNMTVAVGTLNGLIFYANVVYANKSILLPFQETNFLTVFISWLNLELGIDTCYFPGMDIYIKTWLQLAFPAYVILLVVLVIIISSYSTKFSNLIGKKNPVATMATLILLSYAKFLEICFKSLTVGILEYPNDRNVSLWLPDATLKYLSGKHIPLFLTAVLILLVGMVYTALLFSWQWLLYLPKWRIFKLVKESKDTDFH